jgi:hypothetical protein
LTHGSVKASRLVRISQRHLRMILIRCGIRLSWLLV